MSEQGQSGSFLRNTAWLVAGNVAARLLVFALMPVITRLFPPEAFGAFAVFSSVLAVLVAICHLRYPVAVYLPEEARDVDALAALTMLIILAFTLATALAVALFGPELMPRLHLEGQRWLLWLLPPGVFLGGLGVLQRELATRHRRFAALAGSRFGNAAAQRGINVADGLWGAANAFGLAAGRIGGFALTTLILLRPSRLLQAAALPLSEGFGRIRTVAVRYRDFPKYSFTALLQQGSLQLPVLALTSAFAPTAVGFFALSRNILQEPINLLGEALARVYSEHTATLLRDGQSIAPLTLRFFAALTALSLVPLALVGAAATELFGLLFGAVWAETGSYVMALIPFYVVVLVSLPLGALFDLMERQRARVVYDLVYFGLSAAALGVGFFLPSPVHTVLLFSAVGTLVFLHRTFWLLALAGVSTATALALCARQLVLAAGAVALVIAASHFTRSALAVSALAMGLAALHLAITALWDRDFMLLLQRRRRRKKP